LVCEDIKEYLEKEKTKVEKNSSRIMELAGFWALLFGGDGIVFIKSKGTMMTNSIRTYANGVRFSSYQFVVFFTFICEPQFIADFAVCS